MLNTPSAMPGAARSPHSLNPAVPTARGCPGITQPGHCSTVAQPCLLLPEQSLKLFLLRKKKTILRKGRASAGNRRGWRRHPGATGTCCSAPAAPHAISGPLCCPCARSPQGQPGQAARRPCSGSSTQRSRPGTMEPPALPPCRPLPPPAPAERAGTGTQPARHGGCCHTGALCWCKIPAGDTRHPQPRHVPNPPFLAQFRQPLA